MSKNKKRPGRKTRQAGVLDLGSGRYRIRGKATCPRTGRKKEFDRVIEADSVRAATLERFEVLDGLFNEVEPQTEETVGDWAQTWVEAKCAAKRPKSAGGGHRLTPTTQARYRNSVSQVIVPRLGHVAIALLTRRDITFWRDDLGAEYRASTVNGHLRVLRQLLADHEPPCFAARMVQSLPEDDTLITDDEPNMLDEDEVVRFLEHAKALEPQHYPLLLLLLTTGMRISTALALYRTDFDFEAKTVTARHRLSGKDVLEGVKRSRTARDVLPLHDALAEAVRDHWEGLTPRQRRSGLAFPSRSGGHRARSHLDQPLKRICAAAQITKRFTVHGCRRTCTELWRRAAGERVSMEIAGHLTTEMHRRYTRVDTREKAVALNKAFPMLGGAEAHQKGGGERGGEPQDS